MTLVWRRITKKDLQNPLPRMCGLSTSINNIPRCNQMDVISEYAKRRGLDNRQIYSDEGKRGLNIKGAIRWHK